MPNTELTELPKEYCDRCDESLDVLLRELAAKWRKGDIGAGPEYYAGLCTAARELLALVNGEK